MDSNKIEELFNDIIDDTDEIEDAGFITGAVTSNQTDNSVKVETKEKKKKSRKKKITSKVKYLETYQESFRLSALDPDIIKNTRLLSVGFPDTDIKTEHSWIEFLLFLVGAIYQNNPDEFIDIIAPSGIFDNNISIRKHELSRFQVDYENGLEVYRIPGLDYYIDYFPNCLSLFSAIVNALKVLGIKPEAVTVELENPSLRPKELDIEMVDKTYDLSELANTTLSNDFNPYLIKIDDEPMECENFRHAVLLVLSYLLILYPEKATEVLKSNTTKDVVGVTEDNQDYLGFMRVTPLPNSKLYFYSNGLNNAMAKYLYICCEELDQNSENIYFVDKEPLEEY